MEREQRVAFVTPIRESRFQKAVLPVCLALAVALSWTCATQFTKAVFIVNPGKFYAPYFLVWFNTNFMAFCYPTFLLLSAFGGSARLKHEQTLKSITTDGNFRKTRFVPKVVVMLILWVLANVLFSTALGQISASAATSIISSNTLIVWALGWCILGDEFSWLKGASVCLAMLGVVGISLDEDFAGSATGISAVLLSAVFAAVYKVLFKRIIGHTGLGPVSFFMSSLGVANLLMNTAPAAAFLHFGLDKIEFGEIPWAPLIGSAILGATYNFVVNVGIALLNPLTVSVGALLGIPVNACFDILFRDLPASPQFAGGALLIILSLPLCLYPTRTSPIDDDGTEESSEKDAKA